MGNSLKEIRRKISSVQNTQKTTRAMKLVSSSKLKKAEDVAKSSRVFAQKLNEMFQEIVQKLEFVGFENISTPLFHASSKRESKIVDLIFITAEKGLCGGFNQATIKEVANQISQYKERGIQVRLRGVGKKGVSYFSFNGIEIFDSLDGLSANPNYETSSAFLKRSIDDFICGKTDEVVIIYNGFKTMISQEVKIKKILPFEIEKQKRSLNQEMICVEPVENEEQILEELAKKYTEYNFYYALLDSLVAEHSARVQAMDAATNNAGNLVRSLTISYNKARQEAITTELVEINAGVEAMK
ncbi:ATP synthase F1 subunit gamma [Helicobacter kayseriensis]|uniref:ATP synthase F1 subunit gamma n=1 Tax=Helicobacter kayseriensis TaxID=2905877 RepID=UPI001E3BCA4B|nr:ATP synthase F1 subunit gamma [Helicobacter kayseriensis]MCE3046889.1 F0F1 ATP synthase subunit gamma [Helicobacter kayseriensis]MCE3048451.1 F0F1 ATP synthase subunit gamma [Helicobacter kayseriensis]